ncbi:DinB family protein [Paenibacillus hodogayensis]|uniref:DinB family protein n=1 Tax=Paenibacillus hodogayensis TaxID=279208 RepID=A0ABV5W0U6_9BACL
MSLRRPEKTEFGSYFARYTGLVPEGKLTEVLQGQTERMLALFGSLSEEDGSYRYAPDKWSVKQVLGHITDTERIMGYRMLCIARGDASPLPGFDENRYAEAGEFDRLPLADLLADFRVMRASTLSLIGSLPESGWDRSGTVSGNAMTSRALAYIIAGHALHHLNVLEERYDAVIGKL